MGWIDAHFVLMKRGYRTPYHHKDLFSFVLGHTVRSDSDVKIPLGVFGSHVLHACPSSIEEIVPYMMVDTLNDARYVCNGVKADQSWKTLNMAMGRMVSKLYIHKEKKLVSKILRLFISYIQWVPHLH
jgi:hypothetical protein